MIIIMITIIMIILIIMIMIGASLTPLGFAPASETR